MTLTRLLLRRHRWPLAAWLILLVALCTLTVTSYQDTYDTPEQRRAAVDLAQANAASTMMYGTLPDPGTPAQMLTWEIGAFVTILTAVMAVLVAVWLTRATEDDGTLELLRGSGLPPGQALRSTLTIQVGLATVLGAGCAAGVALHHGTVDGVTRSGALAFGAVIALTFATFAAIVTVLAQIALSAGQTRVLGFAAIGGAFALRAVADTQQLDWLNWLTPLGLRGTVEPFTTDQWWALAPATGATVVLAVAAVRLSRRREFGAGLISRRDTRTSRLRVRGPAGLAVRLSRASLLAWTAAVAVIGTFFVTIGAGTVERGRDGDVGGFLGAQLGAADPVAGYLAYCATVVGILVSVYAVLSVLNARHSEERGLTDLILTTGVRRRTPLATQAAVTAAGCAVILTVTGLVTAMTAPAVINGDDIAARSIAYTVGQWPATMAVTGCAVLLIGLRPSTAWLAWLPLVASAALALLGDLLRIPDTIQRLGVFRHVPDISAADPNITALGVLLCIGAALCLIGTAATARRDVAL